MFDETKRDDVLHLIDLVENNIDPGRFFDEISSTLRMKALTAFKRFHRKRSTGVVELTQSIGGGKRYNTIALGLILTK